MTMDSNIVKFPFTASRRAFARKPRWSKNGTPEERAAKAAAMKTTEATVTKLSGADTAQEGPSLVEFLQHLKAYFVQEFARGKEVDQIFDDLEGSYRRADKARPKS